MYNEFDKCSVKISELQSNISKTQDRIRDFAEQRNRLIVQQINYIENLEDVSKKLGGAQINYDNEIAAKNTIKIDNYKQQVHYPATYKTVKVCKGHDTGNNIVIGCGEQWIRESLAKEISSGKIQSSNLNYLRPLLSKPGLIVTGTCYEYGYRYTHNNDDVKCNNYSNSSKLAEPDYYKSEITAESKRQYDETIRSADEKITQFNEIRLKIAKEEEELKSTEELELLKEEIEKLETRIKEDNIHIADYTKELEDLESERSLLQERLENFKTQNLKALELISEIEKTEQAENNNPLNDFLEKDHIVNPYSELGENISEYSVNNTGDVNKEFISSDIYGA